MDDLDLASLAKLAEEAARAAGALLLEGQRRVRQVGAVGTKTSLTDMVTEMDHASEELVVGRLLAGRPDDGILGEEGSARQGTSGVRWVIDPLDGTTNYLYGHPTGWAVSIAAEVDGDALVGVVADPSLDEVFTATHGGGAFLNGEPIRPSGKDDLATALVATGFAYLQERRQRQAAVLTEVLPAVRDIRRHGAASLDLCWVACGRVDGYFEVGLQPWDVAAGAVVAAESGAVVGGIAGGPASAASVMAAAPALARDLRDLLLSAGASQSF